MKKRLFIISGLIVAFLAGTFYRDWTLCDPKTYPPEWDRLTVGMTHREAEKIIPSWSKDPEKGYFAGKRPGWSLNIMFDKNLQIESITKDYTCEHHGLRNRMIFISKDESFERKWRKDTPITP